MGGTLDLATSLTRNYLLENPAALRIWQEEEELALRCFEPGPQARELQRQVLAARGADAALADAYHARPGLEGYGEPFGPCMRIWRVNASHAHSPSPGVTGDNLLMTRAWSESSLVLALLSSGKEDGWSRRLGEDGDSSGSPLASHQASLDHPVPASKTPDFYTLDGRADDCCKKVEESCTLWDDARWPWHEISEDSEIGPELMRAAPCRPTRLAAPRPLPFAPQAPGLPVAPADLTSTSLPSSSARPQLAARSREAAVPRPSSAGFSGGREDVTSGGTATAAAGMVVAKGNGMRLAGVVAQEVVLRIGTVLRAVVRAGASAALRVLRGAGTSSKTTERY